MCEVRKYVNRLEHAQVSSLTHMDDVPEEYKGLSQFLETYRLQESTSVFVENRVDLETLKLCNEKELRWGRGGGGGSIA